MSCGQWEERIAGEMGEEFSREVVAHLRACTNCARLAEELENDRHRLAAPPPDAADADFGAMRPQIRSAILRERRLRRYLPALAAAAAVIIAVILVQSGPHLATKPPVIQRVQAQPAAPAMSAVLKPKYDAARCCASAEVRHALASPRGGRRRDREGELMHSRPVGAAPIDLALLRKVTGQQTAADTGSESPVEMQIATANPDVTIILLQAKEGSYE